MIAWGLQDPQLQEWYITNQERINAMEFSEYMNELQDVWLPSDWERTARTKILSTPQGDRIFWEWALEMQNLNARLLGTLSHLRESALCNQLEPNRNLDLAEAC